jgi:hypothetical protein
MTQIKSPPSSLLGVHVSFSIPAWHIVKIGRARAMLIIARFTQVAQRRHSTRRIIVIQEGRGELWLTFKPGLGLDYSATVRRIAARMKPALR